MNNKLVFVTCFAAMFLIFGITSERTSSIFAQTDPNMDKSTSTGTGDVLTSEAKKTPLNDNIQIITPWNTGNDKNNAGGASNTK
ncbi:MAG TPA: hypothetical protein VD815_06610 [Candidatus Saccharimonadales bacterium]|nr:hypothetical protein [Candidatus Saccharimonadales bacterium]